MFWECYGIYNKSPKYFLKFFFSQVRKHIYGCAFINYMADSLYYQAQEKRLTVRFADMVEPKEEKTAEQIILETMEKGGLSFRQKGE